MNICFNLSKITYGTNTSYDKQYMCSAFCQGYITRLKEICLSGGTKVNLYDEKSESNRFFMSEKCSLPSCDGWKMDVILKSHWRMSFRWKWKSDEHFITFLKLLFGAIWLYQSCFWFLILKVKSTIMLNLITYLLFFFTILPWRYWVL